MNNYYLKQVEPVCENYEKAMTALSLLVEKLQKLDNVLANCNDTKQVSISSMRSNIASFYNYYEEIKNKTNKLKNKLESNAQLFDNWYKQYYDKKGKNINLYDQTSIAQNIVLLLFWFLPHIGKIKSSKITDIYLDKTDGLIYIDVKFYESITIFKIPFIWDGIVVSTKEVTTRPESGEYEEVESVNEHSLNSELIAEMHEFEGGVFSYNNAQPDVQIEISETRPSEDEKTSKEYSELVNDMQENSLITKDELQYAIDNNLITKDEAGKIIDYVNYGVSLQNDPQYSKDDRENMLDEYGLDQGKNVGSILHDSLNYSTIEINRFFYQSCGYTGDELDNIMAQFNTNFYKSEPTHLESSAFSSYGGDSGQIEQPVEQELPKM